MPSVRYIYTRCCIKCDKYDELAAPVRGQLCTSCSRSRPRLGYRAKKVKAKYRMWQINGKRIYAHRAVMEAHLGRKLERHEHVHHIDHNTHNNDINNLQILTSEEHSRMHMTEMNKADKLYLKGAKARWSK